MIARVVINDTPFKIVNFTKNGVKVGPNRYLDDGDYYPAIGFYSKEAKVSTNMGKDSFLYSINGMISNTRLLWNKSDF